MKRSEQLTHLRSLPLADLQREIFELEKKLEQEKVVIAFGKSKQVRNLRNLKRNLARSLTVANQKLAHPQEERSEK